ncbi:GTA-like head spike base protein [Pseudanabaena phage Pan1]|nr:GTA-like head spike base protein [Pseudanabaena phage Pan1]
MRPSDRIDSADGAVSIPLDEDLSPDIFALNCAVSGWVYFIGRNNLPGSVYVAAGIAFPLRVRRVLSEGTTAQGLRGLV